MEAVYKTTAKKLTERQKQIHRQTLNLFKDKDNRPVGDSFTETQLLIYDAIVKRRYPRTQLILPTQYGKSYAVSLSVLFRAAINKEKWAIIAPTEDKARIIMDYIIEHIFDSELYAALIDYNGTKEQLMQERSKTRITFRGAGEIRIYTADVVNTQKVKKALAGFGAQNIILDESGLISDEVYAMVKRMVGGYAQDSFLLEIGNPFFRNHFWRTWQGKRYTKIFCDAETALAEGRYTRDYLDEMKDEAFYDVLYECKFPDEDEAPPGYRALLSLSHVENAFISHEMPLGHNQDGSLIDKPILGIDPNHGGSNYTVMTIRYPFTGFAKLVLKKQYKDRRNITEDIIADAIKLIEEYDIEDWRTGVDAGGVGAGVADGLERKGYYVTSVLFGQKPENSTRYANIKAELYMNLRKWIVSENGKLLKHDGFLELKEINYKENTTSKVQMESKEELSKRGVASPDVADALALTFINVGNVVDDDEAYSI